MWVFTKPRNEHERRFMLNMDHFARITVSQIGEKFFVDAVMENDTFSLAAAASSAEADSIIDYVYESIKAGEKAIDILKMPQKDQKDSKPAPQAAIATRS